VLKERPADQEKIDLIWTQSNQHPLSHPIFAGQMA